MSSTANDVALEGVSWDTAVPIDSAAPRAASASQQRQWVMAQIELDGGPGMLVARTAITGALDVQRIAGAVRSVLERHPILRSNFKMAQGELVWTPGRAPELMHIDLRTKSAAEAELTIVRWVADTFRGPVDLSAGHLLQVALFTRSDTEHVLSIRAHQSVCDRTSAGLFIAEIANAYSRLKSPGDDRGTEGAAADFFAVFTERQRNFLDGPASEAHLEFWRAKLKGDLPALEMPEAVARIPDSTVSSTGEKTVSTVLSASQAAHFATLVSGLGGDVQNVLLAAMLVVLHRLSGQEDVLVGLPHDGRSALGTEGLIGSIDDEVILRAHLGDDPTFAELVVRLRNQVEEVMAHRQVPLARVIEELFQGQKRKQGQAPLYQTTFIRPIANAGAISFDTANAGPVQFDSACDQDVELEVSANQGSGTIDVRLRSRPGGLTTTARQRLLGRIGLILKGAAADPQTPVSRLPLLDDEERKQILEDWNCTEAEYPAGLLVHQLFEAQAQLRPDAIAVSGKDFSLTYSKLNAAADTLAARLRAMGVESEARVGVLLDRTADMLIAVLAVLKTGAAYVPLDPAYPADRVEYMLADSEAPVLITQSWLLNRATQFSGQTVIVDQESTENQATATDAPATTTRPENAAYVIYTSGSTGKPKGVEVLHRGVVNFLNSMAKAPGFGPDDVMLAITTLCFDIAGLELFLPLSVGGRIVLVDRATAADGLALAQFLTTSDVTVMQATPATWRMLIEAGWKGGGALKRVLTGGEALAPDLAARLLERAPEVWNVYGPTETTIWSTVTRVETAPRGNAAVSIGRPIDNTSCYVLDRHAQPVPAGVAGELYIGGHGVARGYLKRPELTAEKFVADPFLREPGARMYRTGDVVRYRPDGSIDYLGRGDHQVKIRGHRIELGEIEAELLRLPDVQSAVVVAREDKPHPKRLVGYVVPRSPAESNGNGDAKAGESAAALAQHYRTVLRARLPEYMVPSAIMILGALPMTPNGKIDRKALPAPESDLQSAADFVAPVGFLEQQLAGLFAKALNVPRVGATDNFFDLGGDSLRAVSLAVLMQEQFKATIALGDLFQAPTVRQMAAVVRGDQSRHSLPGAPLAPVMLRQGDPDLAPLFYFPGAGGYSFEFRVVAHQLPPGRTVYGFNLPGAGEPGYRPKYDIKELAADMVKAVRVLCPNGPYLLCGYSFGGFLSVEVARMLIEQGVPPALLLILDTWAPGFPHKIRGLRNIAHHARNIMHGGGLRYLATRFDKIRQRITRKVRWWARRRRGTVIADTPGDNAGALNPNKPIEDRIAEAYDAAVQAEEEYRPAPYPGGITLFRATLMPDWPNCSFEEPTNGWSAHVRGPIKVIEFECEHLDLFISQWMPDVARHMNEAMEAAVAAAPPSPSQPSHS